MGVNDVLAVSRVGAGRSMRRAITASVLGTIRKNSAEKVLRVAWGGRDEGALQFLVLALMGSGFAQSPPMPARKP
jgi:hypothetical protein